jgi:hypothetical protein
MAQYYNPRNNPSSGSRSGSAAPYSTDRNARWRSPDGGSAAPYSTDRNARWRGSAGAVPSHGGGGAGSGNGKNYCTNSRYKSDSCRITRECMFNNGHADQCQMICHMCDTKIDAEWIARAAHTVACLPSPCVNAWACRFSGNKKQLAEHSMLCETNICSICNQHIVGMNNTDYFATHQTECGNVSVQCDICKLYCKRCNIREHRQMCSRNT